MIGVTIKDAKGFSNVWTAGGVAIPMQDVHLQFATDFANVVLRNFIQQANAAAAAKQKAAEQQVAADAAPKVVLTDGK